VTQLDHVKYHITTYKEGYIEDQVAIGSQLYDAWPMGGQTRADQLKETYHADSFDPSTRFYAFDGDKMVGFLTASFNEEKDGKSYYYFEFPYVLPDHAPDAERQLIEYALTALEQKGADVLVARAGEYWGKSLFYAKEYGFVKTDDIARRGVINLLTADPTSYGDPSALRHFDPTKDIKPLAKIYAKRFNTSVEQMESQLNRWRNLNIGSEIKSPWDQTLTVLEHAIAEEDGEILGRLVAMNVSTFGDDTININQMAITSDHDEIVGYMLARAIQAGKEQGKSTLVLHTGQWGVTPDDEMFEQYNIQFEMKLAYFEKQLNG